MTQKERLEQIRSTIKMNERVVVSALSKQFNVTEETIRRDLEKLESEGLVTRTYGGAILNSRHTSIRGSYSQRTQTNVTEKRAIAQIVADLIPKHKIVVGSDSSSTVFEAVKLLKNNGNLLLMTYAADILQELADAEMRIMSTGGLLNKRSHALQGVIARNTIKSYNMDIFLVSCKGLSLSGGIFDSDEDEVEIKQIMAEKASQVILLADHTKFDCVAFAKLLDFDQINTIVTDRKPSSEWTDLFASHHVELLFPPES